MDFVHGRLAPPAVNDIECHIDDCAGCRRLLSAVARTTVAVASHGDRASEPSTEDDRAVGPALRFLLPGQQLGRYAIGGLRGIGSMGVVYAAHDTELDRAVALKLLRYDAVAGALDVGRARLVREAQALARLSHPNVVAVHDIGVYADEVFAAMELVDGAALDEWLQAAPRTATEILAVMIGAGRGLAAAHAAGLIHRDVKPENILVGLDGRARMTDFGLAHVATSEASPSAPDAGEHDGSAGAVERLTRTGSLLGTPAYMSPEQLCARPVGPASDQFSFAVTLYEALYGERPFRGDTLAALRERVLAGGIAVPRRDAAVPRKVRRALQRALSVDPAQRFSSMDALLDELGDDHLGRRRAVAFAAAAGALALAAATLWIAGRGGGEPPCTGAAHKLEGTWDAARRDAVERAFVASGEAFATDAFARVARGLDAYTGAWVAMHTDACEASAVRGEQAAEVLTLRMACLGKDLELVRQLIDLFSAPGFTGTSRTVVAVDGLPRLADCADIAALKTVTPLPTDPVQRARLAALDVRVAELEARWLIDDFKTVLQSAPALIAEARSIGYPRTTAAVLLIAGEVESAAGSAQAAEEKLYQALWAAEAAHDAEQQAWAWIRITRVVGYEQRRFAEADRLLGNAEQAVERASAISPSTGNALRIALLGVSGALAFAKSNDKEAIARASEALALEQRHFGDDTGSAANLHHSLARFKVASGDPIGAWTEVQRALTIAEQRFGTGPYAVKFHGTAAAILNAQGKFADAIAEYERALALAAQVFTTDTPQVAVMLGSLATVYEVTGDLARAESLLERALDIFVKTRGPESGEVAATLWILGLCSKKRGQLTAARSYLERALAISERIYGPTHFEVAEHLLSLGGVLVELGQQARAIPLLERALSILQARKDSGQGGYPTRLAGVRLLLAQALWVRPTERPRARALVRSARELLDPSSEEPRMKQVLSEVKEWLAKYDAGRAATRSAPATTSPDR